MNLLAKIGLFSEKTRFTVPRFIEEHVQPLCEDLQDAGIVVQGQYYDGYDLYFTVPTKQIDQTVTFLRNAGLDHKIGGDVDLAQLKIIVAK